MKKAIVWRQSAHGCSRSVHKYFAMYGAQNNSHVGKLVSVIVVVLADGTRLVAGDVGLRLAAQLHHLQASAGQEVTQVSTY